MSEIKNWWFSKKIEDMPKEELEKRIKEVMEIELPYKINPIPYVGVKDELVSYSTDELVALCPMTGYPDFYELVIEYIPDKTIPELKSLKFYLMQYKEIPVSHEHLASKIFNDFKKVVKPKALKIRLKVARRGGIDTWIELSM